MARGDQATPNTHAVGMTFVGLFGVAALGAVLFVILATNACNSCEQWVYGMGGAPSADPYVGASTAARLLGWRDTGRLRALYGAVPPFDGPTAHFAVDGELRRRGYLAPGLEGEPLTLPAEVTLPELDRSCGVVEIEAIGTSHLSGAGRGTSLRSADDPSVITLGACGEGPYRVEGVGTARVRVHLMPGVVTGDVERTELPEEVLLAHAEAEVLLSTMAYTPSDQIVRVDVTSGTSGIVTFAGLPDPPSGCVPWVVVVTGAGRSRSHTLLSVPDHAAERAQVLAVTCAGGTGSSFDLEDAGDGYVAWARPYSSAGASIPTEAAVRIAEARVVDLADLVLPTPMPAAPAP